MQEPYVSYNKTVGISNLWNVFLSHDERAGIVLCNKSTSFVLIHVNDSSVFIKINCTDYNVLIGSVYAAPSGDICKDLKDVGDVIENCNNYIIAGDYNGKSRIWGCSRTDIRGEEILNFINVHDLNILNDLSKDSTFYHAGRSGNPDLTLCSADFVDNINNWNVLDHPDSLSDHRYITYEIKSGLVVNLLDRYYTKHGKYGKLKYLIGNSMHSEFLKINNVDSVETMDECVKDIINKINNICSKCFKKKKFILKNTLHWYTEDLRIMRNKIKAIYLRFKRTKDIKYKILHSRERARYKLKIKEAKDGAWKNYCNKTSDTFGKAFNIMKDKDMDYRNYVHVRLEDMSLNTSSTSEINENLIKFHFNIVDNAVTELTSLNNFPAITLPELLNASNLLNADKAPGYDLIDLRIWRVVIKVFPGLLLNLFNRLCYLGYFPRSWKIAKVIFFTKKNKVATSPGSYRPVCLLNTISKLFEKILYHRIIYYLKSKNVFHKKQYGFMEGVSTTDCLYDIINDVKNRKLANKYTALISLDFKSAFDMADWDLMIRSFERCNLPVYILYILKSYLCNRYVFTENVDKKYLIGKGCPQGSCFGPLFWQILVNDILWDFDQEDCTLVAYADDFLLIVSENSRRNLESKVNMLLDKFHYLSISHKLVISTEKTVALTIGKSLERRNPIFKINNNTIKIVNVFKYLGVIIDNKLSFIPHINFLKEEIVKLSLGVKRVRGATWGVPPEMIKTWYVVLVQSRLTYCIPAWYPCINIHGRRSLSSCQRAFLLKILPAYRSVSTEALNVITGVPPINILAQTLCDKYNFNKGTFSVYKENEYISNYDIDAKNCKYMINPIDFPSNILLDDLIFTDNNTLNVYTDGSKNDIGTGYAFAVFKNYSCIYKHLTKLRYFNSVYQAEALAILEAIRWIIDNNYCKANIFTDSKSVIDSLRNLVPNSNIISEIHNILSKNRGVSISVNWIKAHVGNPGNEFADTIAKYSILAGKDQLAKYPVSFKNKHFKTVLYENWQRDWDYSDKGRFTYDIYSKVTSDLKIKNKVLIYFVTGKGSFPTYLFAVNKKADNLCSCGEEGTPHHYLQTRCSLSKTYIKRKTNESLESYFKRIDNSFYYINKVKNIYEELNKNYFYLDYCF